MARRKRRKSFLGIIIIFVLIVGLAALLAFGISKVLFKSNDPVVDNPTQETPQNPQGDKHEEEVKDDYKVELIDYEVYYEEELDLDFIIAQIKIKNTKPINYPLSNLGTSEGIILNDVSNYIDVIEEAGYSFEKYDLVKSVAESKNNEDKFYIFIPFSTDDTMLSVKSTKGDELNFNLQFNYVDIETLRKDGGTNVVKDDLDIYATDAQQVFYIFENGSEYEIPSSKKIYNFVMKVNKIGKDITLKSAEFVAKNGQTYSAMPKEYTFDEYKNMFDGVLESGKSYDLFFKVVSPDSEPLSYSGTLKLVLSNSNEVIEIPANFN